MGQWAVSGVQAISAAPAAMTTRPSRILSQYLSNTSPRSQVTSYIGKTGNGRIGVFSCQRRRSLRAIAPAALGLLAPSGQPHHASSIRHMLAGARS